MEIKEIRSRHVASLETHKISCPMNSGALARVLGPREWRTTFLVSESFCWSCRATRSFVRVATLHVRYCKIFSHLQVDFNVFIYTCRNSIIFHLKLPFIENLYQVVWYKFAKALKIATICDND